jgi:hypothetical protein
MAPTIATSRLEAGSDGGLYVVRLDELRADWELTTYEHAGLHQAAIVNARRRQIIAD